MTTNTIEVQIKGDDEVIAIDDQSIVTFEEGMVGCPEWRRFALFASPEERPIGVLQSLDDEDACFLVTDPRHIWPDYAADVDGDQLEALGAASVDELEILCTLRVHENDRSLTANLLGPLMINPRLRRGLQAVQYESDYLTDQPIPETSLADYQDALD